MGELDVNKPIWLAEHGMFSVWADHDYTYVKHSDGRIWNTGWMYGNAVAALVTWDENYAVIVGCGIMICDLRRFGEDIKEGETWDATPVVHLMAKSHLIFERDATWWFALIEQVFQDEDRIEIRLATDLLDPHVGIYSLNPETFEFLPVLHGQAIP